jgi:hypothetical protein
MFRFRPALRVESLESREAPSALTPPPPAPPAVVRQQYALTGNAAGVFHGDEVQSGAGLKYHLDGSAQLAGPGQVSVSGTISAVGFIQRGRAGGTLTLSNGRGSVTLEVTGLREQGSFEALPKYFRYRVTGGTGEFHGLAESGTMRIDLLASASGPMLAPHGTFRIAI